MAFAAQWIRSPALLVAGIGVGLTEAGLGLGRQHPVGALPSGCVRGVPRRDGSEGRSLSPTGCWRPTPSQPHAHKPAHSDDRLKSKATCEERAGLDQPSLFTKIADTPLMSAATDSAPSTCPNCHAETEELITVDAGLRLRIQEISGSAEVPSHVCAACIPQLQDELSQGAQLLAQQRARAEQIQKMWETRIDLIKQGRLYMDQKLYSEAAVSYEKYLKVLELSFQVEPGGLKPELFADAQFKKEITVIVGVYWDLFRLYDQNPQLEDRMKIAGTQLASFARFSPIFPDIVRRAMQFKSHAKHPTYVKQFLKMVNAERPQCFVATFAFEDKTAHEVLALRTFRDQVLKKSKLGRQFVHLYYQWSPVAVRALSPWPATKPALRVVLRTLVWAVELARKATLRQIDRSEAQQK